MSISPVYCCYYTLQNKNLATICYYATKQKRDAQLQVSSATETIIVSNAMLDTKKLLQMPPASLTACCNTVAVCLDSAQDRRLH